ncbi:unnamed protein product [Pylaiella littoralis]
MRKMKRLYLQAADAYSSGLTTFGAVSARRLGASGIVAVVAWGATTAIQRHAADQSKRGHGSGSRALLYHSTTPVAAAIIAAFLAVVVFDIVLRQKTFTKLTGEGTLAEHVVFFALPLAAFGLDLNLKNLKNLSAFMLAAVAVVVAKKSCLVSKQNDLERRVFEQIANVLDACQAPGKAGCSHRHAGYVDAFNNMVRPHLPAKNAAEVARGIASRLGGKTL